MRKALIIGNKKYKCKKDAIAHYKGILNSYNYGESLSKDDFEDILDLLYYDYLNYLTENENLAEANQEEIDNNSNFTESSNEEIVIEDIKVSRVQFNTKCFEVFYSDRTSLYISYLMLINNKGYSQERLFYVACRNAVHQDIRSVKQAYFDSNSVKGQVKCQETDELSTWTELVVDHRQPNTFSIIVDRFKEVKNINHDVIEYTSNEQNHIIFKDETLIKDFREYHKNKSVLRVVRRECNSSRTGMARVGKSSRDLTIQ
ncbi:DUF3223 domain-containing protein [Pontibacter anaerobius]|uniref:DUF3223 domain-containing protein n=1 Tax=Pontibacter anaerobius TaxID=2993940 RepID=A0ABT3RDM3_9BACT|nr:DUF3223 domain-containing protein [Pontibacter anaerobius]MCX2739632.1 DUF3223 domain-containing protein [Pontibacter anaerobius]